MHDVTNARADGATNVLTHSATSVHAHSEASVHAHSAMEDTEAVAERLERLRARYPQSDPAMVAEVVRTILASMSGDLTGAETALLAEVEELGRTISAAKAEIAAIGMDDITGSHIPSATDELDAIVEHTASATNAILEACETLDAMGTELDSTAAGRMQDVTTRIYEACSFQDITGQRISKIVATLKAIDAKVAHIVAAFRPHGADAAELPTSPPEAALLNGPQLPTNAMDQSDIDKLLAEFG
jgi:chemotaxis protein CheZ